MNKIKREYLNKFFYPKSIAIFGASENEEKVGGILMKKAIKSKIETIPVNPKYEALYGKKCYKDIKEYDGEIDLAVISIPAEYVLKTLENCGKKKIKNAIIITSGFSELGNKKAEDEILNIAKKYGIRFIGTNCFGICNPEIGLDLTFSMNSAQKGNIAFISQSGALWSYISDLSADNKTPFGFSKFVSLGNMNDLDFNDFINYFANDEKTNFIVLYIEKLKYGNEFIKICQRVTKKKKIIAVKGGSSEIGQKAEFSHTASLASDYEIYKGAMKQAKVILCESLIGAFEKASGIRIIEIRNKKIKIGEKVFIITNAGGAGVLMSDYLSKKGFSVVESPLDILGTARSDSYYNAFELVKNKDFDSLFVIVTPQKMTDMEDIAKKIVEFSNSNKKQVIALFLGGKNVKESNKILENNKIIYFNTLEEASNCVEI